MTEARAVSGSHAAGSASVPQADIQRGEELLLGDLAAHERRVFLRVLRRLTRDHTG